MTYSTTDEIQVNLDYDQYREQLNSTIQKIAGRLNKRLNDSDSEIDKEKINLYVIEHLTVVNELHLTHPISVIKYADATLSHRGAERLGDVSSTEDFAQEHARDLFEQDIVGAFEEILDGETVASISTDTSPDSDTAFTGIM